MTWWLRRQRLSIADFLMWLGVVCRHWGLGFVAGSAVAGHYLWHKFAAYDAELTQRLQALLIYRDAHVADIRARLEALEAPASGGRR